VTTASSYLGQLLFSPRSQTFATVFFGVLCSTGVPCGSPTFLSVFFGVVNVVM
jgi:hypothetical protein